jgi:hypothetical protein
LGEKRSVKQDIVRLVVERYLAQTHLIGRPPVILPAIFAASSADRICFRPTLALGQITQCDARPRRHQPAVDQILAALILYLKQ